MTTPQIYALLAMLACIAALVGATYFAGLTTGKAAGEATSKTIYTTRLQASQADMQAQAIQLASTQQTLEKSERALVTARKNLKDEFEQHTQLERDLLDRLKKSSANGLTHNDHLTIRLAAKQLGIAAEQFRKSGSSKVNQAALAQTCLNEVATRLHAALNGEPVIAESVTPVAAVEAVGKAA